MLLRLKSHDDEGNLFDNLNFYINSKIKTHKQKKLIIMRN